ncbi:hypothetical protein DITRI_Ditri08aG0067400 [Diplodiscus trichospermus]
MKNVSRNKFLVCFRPVVDMELMLESKNVVVDRSQNHHASKYVGVKNKEDMKPSATKSSVSDRKNSITIHRSGKKTLSQMIKAVVFEIILVKRVRDGKGIDQESYSSKHNSPLSSHARLLDASFDKSANMVLAGKGIHDTISNSSSVSSRSSCSSSLSSSSSSSFAESTQKAKRQELQNNCSTDRNHQDGEMKPKQRGTDRDSSSSNTVIVLLLISLAVTIFWGNFCAILLTSILLCFLPRQQPVGVIGSVENVKGRPEKMSKRSQKEGHNGRATQKGTKTDSY